MTLCNVGGRLTSMKKLCMAIGSGEGTEVSRTWISHAGGIENSQ